MNEETARSRHVWRWVGISLLIAVAVLGVIAEVMIHRAGPIVKGRVIETLSNRFHSKVELDGFDLSLLRGLEVSGTGLRIYAPDDVVAAGATRPVISIKTFRFHSGLTGLFIKPMHVGTVHVTGLDIEIPPKEMRAQAPKNDRKFNGKIKIVVDEIVCDDSRLIIQTSKPGKDPKDFELQHIDLHDVGPNAPWRYVATLTNAVPKGEIQADGNFGPWDTESAGDSPVNGHYTFKHADLNTIKGIGGMLSSIGDFDGQLDKIHVQGTTDTPDFSIDTANHPMPLKTRFDATVDGTSGDTYLNRIDATLGQSQFTTQGKVINIKGKGHLIALDADVPNGRIQDFLELAVKTAPPVLTGTIAMKSKITIRPGDARVVDRLGLNGRFTIHRIHFTNPKVQDKVDMLSLRAQGDPKEAKPGAADVRSQMQGQFVMGGGKLNFSNLLYQLPGGRIRMEGVYSLNGEQFDFHGKVHTDAKLSQMVASRWKSWLLKPVDPFFSKNGGTEIPVKVSGTKSEPKFGLDFGHKDKDKDNDQKDQKK